MEFDISTGFRNGRGSGKMKISADQAVHQLNLADRLGGTPDFNGWAAANTAKRCPSMTDEDFSRQYNISKDEALVLYRTMYPE